MCSLHGPIVPDYEAMRASAAVITEARAAAARQLAGKLSKAEQAAEATLQLYDRAG